METHAPANRSRWLRWLGIGALLLVALLVIAIGAVLILVKPADYQDALIDAVRERTGRTLTLGKPLGLDLWPCCALKVEAAELSNPPGFPAGPFVSVQSARLALRLGPLLRERRVEIGRIAIDGPQASLMRRADGTNNWTFPAAAEPDAPEQPSPGSDDFTLDIAGVEIRDGRLEWQDEADGSHYAVEGLTVDTGPLKGAEPLTFKTSMRVKDVKEGMEAQISVATPRATIRQEPTLAVTLPDADVSAEVRGKDLPGGAARAELKVSPLSYDDQSGVITLGNFAGTVEAAGVPARIQGNGRIGSGAESPTEFAGSVELSQFSLRDLLVKRDSDPGPTANPKALGALAGKARWSYRENAVAFEEIDMKLDDTRVTGTVRQGLGETGRLRFDLAMDALDLDGYLEPEAAPAATPSAGEGAAEVEAIPTDTLRDLDAEGSVKIGRLRYAGVTLNDLSVTGNAGGGRLRLNPVRAQLYGGTYAGDISVDVVESGTRLRLAQELSSIGLGGFLRDYAEVENVDGKASGNVLLTASGRTEAQLMKSLGGNLKLTVADGVYRGMDVWYEIRRARALIRREAPPPKPAAPETPLQSVILDGPISAGTFRSQDFLAQIPHLKVTGQLALDMPAEQIDGELEALVFEPPTFEDGTSLPDLANVRIPLTVSGALSSPKVRPDLNKMVTESAKEAVRDAAGSAADRFLKRLNKRLGTEAPAEPAPKGETGAPPDGAEAAPSEEPPPKKDPLKDALDRLLKGGS